jgi:ATP-dependent protease ClpP protease subunit
METNTIKFISESNEKAVIEIYGTIGGYDETTWKKTNTINQMAKELNRLKDIKTKEIEVKICSPGGYTDHALAIYDALKDHPAKVVTIVNSMCASAATVIAQAGEVRKMSKNALYLIHHCSSVAYGNDKELERVLQTQDKVNKRMLDIYKERCKDEKKMEELFDKADGKGVWLDAEEALEYGLVDEIYNEEKPVKSFFEPKIMSMLPPLPHKEEEPQQPEAEAGGFIQMLKEIKEAITGKNKNNNENKEEMKKMSILFPLLAVALAMEAVEYKEGEAPQLTEENLSAIENKLKELKEMKEQFESMKKDKETAESNLANAERERDEYKAKWEAQEPAQSKSPNGDDTKKTESIEDYVKNNETYKSIFAEELD